jgi:hypothetical protein
MTLSRKIVFVGIWWQLLGRKKDLPNFFGDNIQHQGLATHLASSGKKDNNALLRNVNKPV